MIASQFTVSPKVIKAESAVRFIRALGHKFLPHFQGLPLSIDLLNCETCLECMGKSKMYASSDSTATLESTGAE